MELRLVLRREVVDALFRLGNLRRGHFLDRGGADVGAVVGVAVRGGQRKPRKASTRLIDRSQCRDNHPRRGHAEWYR